MALRLGNYPTPVVYLPSARLWVKRDDVSGGLYGGNKVRKLERLFDAARNAGKSRVVTVGAAGSHQLVATALYGQAEGFAVEAVVVPQPWSAHGEENLRVALGAGVAAAAASSWIAAAAKVAARRAGGAYFVPLGGSNVTGSLGFVDAARELAVQVQSGDVVEPDVIVVAMGSGGTAAGLAAGIALTSLRTRVVGVAISEPVLLVAALARRLTTKTARAVGLTAAAARARLEVDGDWLGRGYGYHTPEGEAAVERAAREGLTLDATYTAKAFACALARARAGQRVLYWHTLSSAPIADRLAAAPSLPPELSRMFVRRASSAGIHLR